jgi:integrase
MPFDQFGQMYLERVTSQQKSARTERNRVLYWMRVFGKRPIGSINRAELEQWQREKRQAARAATVNRSLGRLRHMLSKAIEWELLDPPKNPMKGIKFLRENNARQEYLTLAECERLVQACVAPWIRTIVIIALHTGMRLSEILRLRWQDINFDPGFILIRDSKNGRARQVPMDSIVTEALTAYPRIRGVDEIFAHSTGARRRDVRTAFCNARHRARLDWLVFHHLRHTFASQFMLGGGDLYTLSKILGHVGLNMTMRYSHFQLRRELIDRLDNIWRQGAGEVRRHPEVAPGTPSVTSRSQASLEADAQASEPANGAGLHIVV